VFSLLFLLLLLSVLQPQVRFSVQQRALMRPHPNCRAD
jgi:hypothetical protein